LYIENGQSDKTGGGQKRLPALITQESGKPRDVAEDVPVFLPHLPGNHIVRVEFPQAAEYGIRPLLLLF
jgi:hypothetical protein